MICLSIQGFAVGGLRTIWASKAFQWQLQIGVGRGTLCILMADYRVDIRNVFQGGNGDRPVMKFMDSLTIVLSSIQVVGVITGTMALVSNQEITMPGGKS